MLVFVFVLALNNEIFAGYGPFRCLQVYVFIFALAADIFVFAGSRLFLGVFERLKPDAMYDFMYMCMCMCTCVFACRARARVCMEA